jgi:hypothetical protein
VTGVLSHGHAPCALVVLRVAVRGELELLSHEAWRDDCLVLRHHRGRLSNGGKTANIASSNAG